MSAGVLCGTKTAHLTEDAQADRAKGFLRRGATTCERQALSRQRGDRHDAETGRVSISQTQITAY